MTELINQKKRTSVSIPRSLILEIDLERGDVSRSRFLLRILEKSRTKENRNTDERNIGAKLMNTQNNIEINGDKKICQGLGCFNYATHSIQEDGYDGNYYHVTIVL